MNFKPLKTTFGNKILKKISPGTIFRSPIVILDFCLKCKQTAVSQELSMVDKGALKCLFFAVAALVGAGLLSCCLLRQPASFTARILTNSFKILYGRVIHKVLTDP